MSYENYLQFQEINDSKDLNKDKLRIVFEIYWNILYNSIEINDFQLAYNMLYFIDEVINEMEKQGEEHGAIIAISRQRRRAIKKRDEKIERTNGQCPQKPLC